MTDERLHDPRRCCFCGADGKVEPGAGTRHLSYRERAGEPRLLDVTRPPTTRGRAARCVDAVACTYRQVEARRLAGAAV